jgi:hypothetical protein
MKKSAHFLLILLLLFSFEVKAQESKSSLSVGTDFVSSYVWRGSKFGNGPAFQPGVKFTAGGFTLGAWGSYCISENEAPESDLYTLYSFSSGISLGINSYYFPVTRFFNMRNHAIELNGGWQTGYFKLSANYIVNEGAGSAGGDTYFELGFQAGSVNFFAGAGNGWYTSDNKFRLCNLGINSTRLLKITDSFSLPLLGTLILNPASGQFFIVAGITL